MCLRLSYYCFNSVGWGGWYGVGVDSGHDHYVTNLFHVAALLTRTQVQRRDRQVPDAGQQPTLHVGEIRLDGLSRQVWSSDRVQDLSAHEFLLAEIFLRLLCKY